MLSANSARYQTSIRNPTLNVDRQEQRRSGLGQYIYTREEPSKSEAGRLVKQGISPFPMYNPVFMKEPANLDPVQKQLYYTQVAMPERDALRSANAVPQKFPPYMSGRSSNFYNREHQTGLNTILAIKEARISQKDTPHLYSISAM